MAKHLFAWVNNMVEKDIWRLIQSDLFRYSGQYSFKKLVKNLLLNGSFKYTFWFRLCEHPNVLLRSFARLNHRILSTRYNISLPRGTEIGFGFYISHNMGIVVNRKTVIGNNVNISQFTTVGTNYQNAAVIGDNVYIGPNVNIIERVIIGNNSSLGAGSVVVDDVPEDATVAGVPAKLLNYENPGRFVTSRWVKVDLSDT